MVEARGGTKPTNNTRGGTKPEAEKTDDTAGAPTLETTAG